MKACVGALFDSLRECVQLIDPQCESGALTLALRERGASTRSHSSDGSGSQSSLLTRVPENAPVPNSLSATSVGQVTRLSTSRESAAARHALSSSTLALPLHPSQSHPAPAGAGRAHAGATGASASASASAYASASASAMSVSNAEALNGNGVASTPSASSSSQFANFFASLNLLSRTTTGSGVKSKSSSKSQMASSLRVGNSKDGSNSNSSRSGRNSVHQSPAAPVIAGVGSSPVGSGPAYAYR